MNQQQVWQNSVTSIVQSLKFAIAASSQLLRFSGQFLKRSQHLGRSGKAYIVLFLLSVILSTSIAACSGTSRANQGDIKLNLVSFSVTKAAHDQIVPKFVEKWQKEHNQNVIFERSYGGSLAQTDEIVAGKQEADVVHLALPLDVVRIEEAGLINSGWQDRVPRRGVVSQSVAAIVTREGNPKDIQTWADLAKEDVNVITANPQTSGIGVWQFLGLWGSVTQEGGDPEQALDFVGKIYKKIPTLTKDAREASDLFFQQGQGDALVTYENEVILAGTNRPKTSYFVPSLNISIDNPVAIVDKNVDKHGTREVAAAFVDFLYSDEAQQEFAKLGYRSVNPFIAQGTEVQFPPIKTLFNAQDLGGWPSIKEKFFAKDGIFDQIKGKS
ncbi:sulfate ABC transporter substrate-binding protein [Microcoleus asticus]|uniref:Sulfate-binding protein n=1 Tax=Microcoleus asticus IPMA8 TaxID=2563858 RepID=A0ABX2CYF4_9CYAN|nr:Sulfate-binding protein [Microcoleus asticus IPMA8]